MAVFKEPSKWHTSLVNSGDANVIPQSTPVSTGKASFKDGFPQITQVPIGAGGIAPDRKDFNGLFKILGDWIFYAQNGGLPTYSADFDYIVGRYVVYNNTLYKCIQANGASSTVVAPDSVSPLGSDYWKDIENRDSTSLIPNQIIQSPVPLKDVNLHLLDGALLSGGGAYAKYISMMGELYNANPTATCWTTESDWQKSVSTYGECGKFVYDKVNNTLRLPKLTSFVQATNNASELGSLVKAGLPNVTGSFSTAIRSQFSNVKDPSGCFTWVKNSAFIDGAGYPEGSNATFTFNASKSSSIYGNSITVQPQAIKYYFYIVVGTVSKADKDFSNVTPNQAFKNTSIAWDKPDFSAGVSYTISDTSNYQFTMSDNGFLAFTFYNTTTSQTAYLKVNSVNVCIGGSFTGVVPVSKNDVVDFKTSLANNTLYGRLVFFPCKGA